MSKLAHSHQPTMDEIEIRQRAILKEGVSSKAFARKLATAELTKCSLCGRRGKVWSHPACGVMVDCTCGARSRMDEWAKGKVFYMRQDDGLYKVMNYCTRCQEPNPDRLDMDGCRDPNCPEHY